MITTKSDIKITFRNKMNVYVVFCKYAAFNCSLDLKLVLPAEFPPLPSAVVLLLLLLLFPPMDGVTFMADMELFRGDSVEFSPRTKATRTPGGHETVGMESLHFR